MKISTIRLQSSTGRRLVGMIAAFAMSWTLAGDSFADLRHNYLFHSGDGTQILDSQGTAHGTVLDGTYTPADGRLGLNGTVYGSLPGTSIAVNTYSALTFEMWSAVSTVHANQYTASVALGTTDAGNTGQNYVMMQPTRAGGQGSSGNFRVPLNGAELLISGTTDLSDGRVHHTVVTINATDMAYYVDGVQIGTQPVGGRSLADVSPDFAYLGRSVWGFDPRLQGAIYEFRIFDDAMDAATVTSRFNTGCLDGCGNLYMEVDRDTGSAKLINELSPKDMILYQIGSAKGALNPTGWAPITNNGAIDPDDTWQINSQTNTNLGEQIMAGGAGDGVNFDDEIPLGNIWTKSPFEDVQFTMTYLDASFIEQQLSVPVFFVNGPNDAPFSRSDFNLDGNVNTSDYLILRANHLQNLEGTLHIDTFDLGDINGDLVNNYLDFRMFKADFIAANGASAFESMLASFGAVPEPGTATLLMFGMAAGGLALRRQRGRANRCEHVAKPNPIGSSYTPTHLGPTLFLIAVCMMIPSFSRAQTNVILESFDPRTDLTGIGVEGGATTLTLVDQGGGDKALQFTATSAAGGFFASGFTIPTLQVEPGPGGPNISPILSDYQLSFDLTINAMSGFVPNLEIWLADGPRFSTNNANLYTAGGLVNGVNNISFPLSQNITTTTPNGFTSPGGNWSPTADDWWLQVNSISFGAPAGAAVDYTIDNIRVTIDIATSLALVVDPDTGQARIRNVSDAPIAMDYYSIESTNSSLLTANFNGTTGWNSLDDQNLDAIGAAVGESWDEVVEANSASRLVEQFLVGETTLAPGQSVGLGAPINPSILNDQLNTLSFGFGGAEFPLPGIGQVLFEDLSVLAGDYNGNGVVDAADYVMWRENPGAFGGDSGYLTWRMNFGATNASAAAASTQVPEPTAGVICGLAICMAITVRLNSGRRRHGCFPSHA